jgi:hypothetical protein
MAARWRGAARRGDGAMARRWRDGAAMWLRGDRSADAAWAADDPPHFGHSWTLFGRPKCVRSKRSAVAERLVRTHFGHSRTLFGRPKCVRNKRSAVAERLVRTHFGHLSAVRNASEMRHVVEAVLQALSLPAQSIAPPQQPTSSSPLGYCECITATITDYCIYI